MSGRLGDPQPSPPSTSTGSTGGFSAAQHLKQKRARSQLSCTPCRQGKLKCNRQHDPACDQCIKRNRESACIFVPPPSKHKPPQNVKGRIRQLESLVVDLMNQNRNAQKNGAPNPDSSAERRESAAGDRCQTLFSEPTPPSDNEEGVEYSEHGQARQSDPADDIDAATAPFGHLRISKDEISYVGESHWGAILDSISELKRDLSDDEAEEAPTESVQSATDLQNLGVHSIGASDPDGATSGLSGGLLGNAKSMTREQIIAAIPEKKVTDRLLSLWFNSPDPFKPIIHAPTFQDEYRRFWRNNKDTPTMWLGLLFAILSLATSFGLRDTDPSSSQAKKTMEEVNMLHSIAASAACLADFTKPKQYTIECLIMYSAGLRSNNAFVNVWLMIGLCVRLALRMGYHRDACHYPAISIFHGEMRRRVWAIISMIDVLMSFQLGLPSMVKTIQSDSQPPRNLLDRDFNVSTRVLPASRGVDELTPSSYTRAKLGIVRVFADAAELSHETTIPAKEEAVRLDRELEEAKAKIPPLLQMPDTNDLVTDPAEQLMCRFNLDLLYLKTKMVLHRRYMLTPFSQLTHEEQARGVGSSRIVCMDSALRVLSHHHTIYSATQSGGQLESVKWYMGSISTHDFLLAAMIICLELSSQMSQPGNYMPDCPHRAQMLTSLEKSQKIWSDATSRRKRQIQFNGKDDVTKGEHMFDETEKASRAMAVMLARVNEQLEKMNQGTSPSAPHPTLTREEPSPASKFWREVGVPCAQYSPPPEMPFNSVVSTYDWGLDAPTFPQSFAPGQGVFHGGGTANSIADDPAIISNDMNLGRAFPPTTSSSNIAKSSQQFQVQQQQQLSSSSLSDQSPDNLSMINTMLGGGSTGLAPYVDWDMWDNSFRIDSADASLPYSLDTMAFGNMLVGGTGPASNSPLFADVWMTGNMDTGVATDASSGQEGDTGMDHGQEVNLQSLGYGASA